MRSIALFAAAAAQLTLPGLGSFGQDDIENQVKIVEWVDRAYYSSLRSDDKTWEAITADVWKLVDLAQQHAEMSLGVALVLYSFFWWRSDLNDEWNTESIQASTSLFARSISYNGCDNAGLDVNEFLGRQCHVRWRYLMLCSSELGRYLALHRKPQATEILQAASGYFQVMRTLPFFTPLEMTLPHSSNFNGDQYPALQRPRWKAEELPLGAFLEANFATFRQELDAILAAKPNHGHFTTMYLQSRNAETQFGPRDLDWETVYFLRDRKWYEPNCADAPRTCALLKERPELADCPTGGSGAGLVRLRAGGRLKPHYGNGPRMTFHLGLITPPGPVLQVGPQTMRWHEGEVMLFDDTYIHSARHDGTEDRYILLAWFCHPCEMTVSQGMSDEMRTKCSQRYLG
jgi:hypothetical protein